MVAAAGVGDGDVVEAEAVSLSQAVSEKTPAQIL
jgi:hypothetical protein